MDASLIHDAARPERVMSDVVSIADLMRPSNYLAAKGRHKTNQGKGQKLRRGCLGAQAVGLHCWQDKQHASSWQCDKRWRRRQRHATWPPAPTTGSIPHTQTERNPNPTPITAPVSAYGRGGMGGAVRGRDRQANKQPSDIYQQPPSSPGYIRAFARLSLLTALDVSGDMAQWCTIKL